MTGGGEGFSTYDEAPLQAVGETKRQIQAVQESQEPTTQNKINEVDKGIERQSKVEKMLLKFKQLADKKGLDGFDVFHEFLTSATPKNQNDFLDKSKLRTLRKTIESSGRFPINEFELNQALIEGSILDTGEIQSNNTKTREDTEEIGESTAKTREDTEEIGESTAKTREDTEEIGENNSIEEALLRKKGTLILSIHSDIDISSYSGGIDRYEELLKSEDSWTEKERNEVSNIQGSIITSLKQGNALEKDILPQAYAQGPEVFKRVSQSLTSLEPSFQTRIDAWSMMVDKDSSHIPAEQKVRLSGALGVKVEELDDKAIQSGNIFTLKNVDGTEVNYDVVREERSIELSGYSIKSEVEDTGDYQAPKLTYMRVEQEHQPKVDIILAATKEIEEKQIDGDDVAEIKATLRKVPNIGDLGVDFESMEEGDVIRTAFRDKLEHHNTKINDAREVYRDELVILRDTHAGVLAQRDIRVKKTLSTLYDDGVTEMPPPVFKQVSDTINIDPSKYGFQTEIDLEQGILGFNASGDNENSDRVRFAKMVNVMLGVESGSEFAINPQANGIGQTAISNRNEFNTYVAEESGWHKIGAANTILERLRNNRSH